MANKELEYVDRPSGRLCVGDTVVVVYDEGFDEGKPLLKKIAKILDCPAVGQFPPEILFVFTDGRTASHYASVQKAPGNVESIQACELKGEEAAGELGR